ncbi:MAG TPA: amidohydrolase family protein [Sphingomicrobium sp.]|nr:amidohydrolase family protein [Sphingomicrobium sp.]
MAERFLIEAANRTVAVENGLIAEPHGRYDVVLRLPGGEIRPGLINAHDHLHRNHYGRLGRPPYRNSRAWGRDVQTRHHEAIAQGREWPRREALLAGAWKNLFAGVTTVVHHDPWERDFEAGFPLRVPAITCVDSVRSAAALASLRPGEPFCLHLAEGTGPDAAAEVQDLERLGLLNADLIAVHGVGLDPEQCARFSRSGAALVWCPSSNLFLFGRTARRELLEQGVDVLLGSDSLLSADGDLLDELRVARRIGAIDDERLADAAGRTAARRLRLPQPSIQPGAPADLIVIARPLLEARARDVQLVVVGGTPRVAVLGLAADLAKLGARGRARTLTGVTRWTSGAEGEGVRLRKAARDREPLRSPAATIG